jgi:hypothetical protein
MTANSNDVADISEAINNSDGVEFKYQGRLYPVPHGSTKEPVAPKSKKKGK